MNKLLNIVAIVSRLVLIHFLILAHLEMAVSLLWFHFKKRTGPKRLKTCRRGPARASQDAKQCSMWSDHEVALCARKPYWRLTLGIRKLFTPEKFLVVFIHLYTFLLYTFFNNSIPIIFYYMLIKVNKMYRRLIERVSRIPSDCVTV